MPIYDFQCPECDRKDLDRYVTHYNDPVICPCGARMGKRLGTFRIRGSPRIPINHIPKSLGGNYDKNDAYWQG